MPTWLLWTGVDTLTDTNRQRRTQARRGEVLPTRRRDQLRAASTRDFATLRRRGLRPRHPGKCVSLLRTLQSAARWLASRSASGVVSGIHPLPASLSCDGGSLRYPFPAAAINSFIVHGRLATLRPQPAKNSELVTSAIPHRIVRDAR